DVLDSRLASPPIQQQMKQLASYLVQGNLKQAEQELMTLGRCAEDEPAFLNLAGLCHEMAGRLDSARRFYRQAFGADPNFTPALENLHRVSSMKALERLMIPRALGLDGPPYKRAV